jgi:PAS domain S-box-containing protein
MIVVMAPDTRTRTIRFALGVVVALFAVHIGHTTLDTPAPPLDACMLVLAAIAAFVCLLRAVTGRGERAGWALLGIALGLWALGDLLFEIAYSTAGTPVPSVADLAYLGYYPTAAAAIFLLIKPHVHSSRVWLDGLIAALALVSVPAALIFPEMLDGADGGPLAVATTMGYAIGDLVLVGFATAIFTMTGFRPGLRWGLIGGGLLVTAAADTIYSYQVATGSFAAGQALDAMWPAAMLLIAMSAWAAPTPRQPIRSDGWAAHAIGVCFTIVGLVVLVLDHYHPVGQGALWLATAALAIRLVRTVLTFKDKSDALRGARHQAHRNEAILNAVAEGVLGIDGDDVVVFANRAAGDLLGVRPDQIVGRPVDVATGTDGGIAADAVQARTTRRPRVTCEATFSRANGDRFPVEYVVAPVAPRSNAGAAVVSFSDVSERQLFVEAARANRAKNEFLSRMSHELRTPLNAVLGFGQLLAMRDLPPDQQDEVDRILKGGQHLLGLIDEVLEISRTESGRRALSIEPIPVGEVVAEVVELVEPLTARRGVTVRVDRSSLPGTVMADRQGLKQVLLNLVANAIKFNRDRGLVTVRGTSEGGRAQISVADTGIGIRPADLPKLFHPFERLGAVAAGIEGTGLGLTLSKTLMEEMDGSIDVGSEPGRGSTFTVELPIAAGSPSPAAPLRRPSAPVADAGDHGPRATVLCIEDNPTNLRLIEGIIARRPGIALSTATDGTTGIEAARALSPDLILLDMNLPDLNGDRVMEILRGAEATRHIPVIVVSADATPAQTERMLELGARDYVTKPFTVGRLLGAVDSAVPTAALG